MFKVLTFCLALSLALSVSHANLLDNPDYDDKMDAEEALLFDSEPIEAVELAVNENGYVFPFYKQWTKIQDGETSVQLKEDFEAAMLFLDGVISQSLVPVEGGPKIKWRTLLHDLHAKRIASSMIKLRSTSPNLASFVMMASGFFHRLLKNSKVIEAELEASEAEKNPIELKGYVHKRITDLSTIFLKSPVALFFDWDNGIIDGESAEKSLSLMMGRLRYHGQGAILGHIQRFLSVIIGLSKLG